MKLALALLAATLFAADLEEIRTALANRVDNSKAVGMVAAVIDAGGRHVLVRGGVSKNGPAPDGDTVFEIGSITKAFTSLLLADMVERGEVKLEDPVAKYLPATVTIPDRDGRQITLLDLSMQVSGLPRMPDQFRPADAANPYVDYDAQQLYGFLSRHKLARAPGEKYEYSNVGVGLLGHVLALKAGMSYEQLVRRRILEPLGMTSTSITLSEAQRKRLAAGHDAGLSPVKNWDFDVMAGAGGLRSTANDMLKFLAASLELTPSPLQAAMRRTRAPRHDTGTPELQIAMGWHVFTRFNSELVWHDGGTAGYRSFAGFDPAAKRGAVVLTNTFFNVGDLGYHLVNSRYTMMRFSAPKARKEIQLDPKLLERYTGEYRFTPSFSIVIVRDGTRLFSEATNQPRAELFAETETQFFLKVVDAQITFAPEAPGAPAHLVLHQNGLDTKAPKVR